GMLLPALARAKQKAMTVKCNSNLRQIAIGLHMYADDSADFYPAYEEWGVLGGEYGANVAPWRLCARDATTVE
ncbi:MAG: DUF1559 domain-containing protein, partial [Verrucomicrobiales bacterium]|nr:DUF1559 domain-containing protein [Verrucomicrobiales bacterium]